MKKFIYLAMIVFASLSMASCDSNDNDKEDVTTTSKLIGKWAMVDGEENTYEFKSDGTGYESEGYNGEYYQWPIKWLESDGMLTTIDIDDSGNYIYNYKILSVTDTDLILREIDEDSSSNNAVYEFKKVSKFFWE